MNWQNLRVVADNTYHKNGEQPAYSQRFDEVLAFHPPGLAAVRLGGQAWHIHPNGQAAYSQRFLRTFGFYEDLAAVVTPTGWQHIDANAQPIYHEFYTWCGNFQGRRCVVRNAEGKYWHICADGQPAYAQRWSYAGDFRSGIAVVQAANGYSTHIDPYGQYLHQFWFLDLDVFHKGFARAKDEAGWMHIDLQGRPIYQRRFAAVEPFYNGQARVECFDGSLEVIDEAGKRLVQLRAALRSEFAELSADMVGFWRTQTIAAAVELGIFEQLPGDVESVAKHCGLSQSKAQRLLRALAELGLVQAEQTHWHCSKRGQYLQAEHPRTLAGAAQEYAGAFSAMWSQLPEALKANGTWQKPTVFADVAADPQRQVRHHQMLLSYAQHDYAEVPAAMRLQGNERIIDAGGGLGALAQALLSTYPELQVSVLERPEVVAQAKALQHEQAGLQFLAQDLFAGWEVQADAVVLARVLHDWDNQDALRILQNARAALRPGGQVFIVEMLLSAEHPAGALCDLHLLMATGGQERNLAEYSALLAQAGFEFSEVRKLHALPSVLVGRAV